MTLPRSESLVLLGNMISMHRKVTKDNAETYVEEVPHCSELVGE